METVHILYITGRWLRRIGSARWLVLGMLWLVPVFSSRAYADGPVITAMTPRGSWTAELTVANCSDTNFNQVIQLSTNLQDWSTISTYTYSATSPGQSLKA